MGPKVSKAKRPKRRWIGISFPSDVESKHDLLRTIESSVLSDYNIKLYDMHIAASIVAKNTRQILDIGDEVGVAIICVLLSDYKDVRLCLASEALHEFTSIASSGKIRLVRNRLALPAPAGR